MKRHLVVLTLLLQSFAVSILSAQTSPAAAPAQPSSNESSAGAEVVSGPRGFLSIDYKGQRFLVPFHSIVSLSRHDYMVDGAGMVHELTIDTQGSIIARYYYLESLLENNPTNAAQILNNRLEKLRGMAEERTGQDTRVVVKHYPDTTHAKTVEFNLASMEQLDRIFAHIYDDWVEHNGKGDGRTLKIR